MVDKKTTQLDENVSPILTDIFDMVDDPLGTPKSEKMTFGNLLNSALITALGTVTSGNVDALLKVSDFGLRTPILQPIADDTNHATGDGKQYFPTPEYLNGWDLTDVRVHVITAGTVSGLFSVMVHNLTQAVDMLSTVCSVDPTELTSDTAATPVVIDTAEDDITTGDVLRIDFDAVHGTVGQGCYVELKFELP